MLRKTPNYFINGCETISDLPHILVPRDRNKISCGYPGGCHDKFKDNSLQVRPPPASTRIIATSSEYWYLNGAQSQDSQRLIHNRETLHVFIILSTFSQHIPSSGKEVMNVSLPSHIVQQFRRNSRVLQDGNQAFEGLHWNNGVERVSCTDK